MKSGLLPPLSPTTSDVIHYCTTPPPPPILDSPDSASLATGLHTEDSFLPGVQKAGSNNTGMDTASQCSHTLKKKKQESMV